MVCGSAASNGINSVMDENEVPEVTLMDKVIC
jgi:hypothetical protein